VSDDETCAAGAERVNRIVRREAAWERYRDTIAMRRVMSDPEPGDVRGWHSKPATPRRYRVKRRPKGFHRERRRRSRPNAHPAQPARV
jgi:hypothetical protein